MADDPIDMSSSSDFFNKETVENISKIKYDSYDINDQFKEIASSMDKQNAHSRSLSTEFTKIKHYLEDALSLSGRLGTSYVKMDQVIKQIERSDAKRIDMNTAMLKLEEKYNKEVSDKRLKIAARLKEFQKGLNELSGTELQKHIQSTNETVKLYHIAEKLKQAYVDMGNELNSIKSEVTEGNDKFIGMTLKASGLAKIFAFISKIPVLGQFMRFDIISEAFLKDFPTGIKAITTQLKGLLTQPLVGFAMIGFALKDIISSVLKMNENMTKVGNNLGMSSNAVKIMYDGFRQSSLEGTKLVGSLDNAFLSVRNMVNASLELQDSLETNAMFTNQMIQGQMLMTKQMGMTAEEAAGIQKFSLLTGKSAESILQSAIKQNNTVISYRKILKEVSTISAELSMRYGNDPEKIAAAVVQANKLGMSLEETRKISSSLLNFESSIEGELESELLLGRQFNFEKARELALAGKSAEAAGDLLGQMGGIHEFEKMNVIQRERFAAAIGLSSDELSKAVKEQSVLTELGEQNRQGLEERYELLRKSNDQAGLAVLQAEAAKVEGGKVMLQDIARASINQRFEESVNRIKDVFTEMAVPLGNIMDKIAKLLEHTFILKSVLVLAAAAMTSMAISATITSFGAAAAAAAPWLAGIAATAAGVGMIRAVNDSMISPSGQIMISTPQGNILPNKNDSIITTTNPGGLLNGGGGGDNLVASKIDELIGHVKKGGNVYIDSTRSGTAYGMSYNSYA
jgi:hypothetical protein